MYCSGQKLALSLLLAVTGTVTNGLGMGLITTAVMVRSGLLFAGAALLLGDTFHAMEMNVPAYDGMLLFALPPGEFVVLGSLIAGKRVLDTKLDKWRTHRAQRADAPACHTLPGE